MKWFSRQEIEELLAKFRAVDLENLLNTADRFFDDISISVFCRLIEALSAVVFGVQPKFGCYPILKGGGLRYGSSGSLVEKESIDITFGEASVVGSSAFESMLRYYYDSPFWDVSSRYLQLECYHDLEEEDFSNINKFLKIVFGDFFSPDCVSEIERGSLKDPREYFSDSEEEDGMVVFKSHLYPYFLRNREYFSAHDKSVMDCICRTITGSCGLYGFSYCLPELEHSYFFSYEDSYMDAWTVDNSWLANASLELMIAGALMDAIILEANNKYNFLPASFAGKERRE